MYFFFNDTATTEIYTLSLHDALPIWFLFVWPRAGQALARSAASTSSARSVRTSCSAASWRATASRSEEHTSELQSQSNLVCRLLLEKKKSIHPVEVEHVSRRHQILLY